MFYKYCNAKSKKKHNLVRLYNNISKTSLATDDKSNADILNTYFASVFTEEIDSPALILNAGANLLYNENNEAPPLEYKGKISEEKLSDITITKEEVYELLTDIDITKSSVSTCIHPQLLKEGAKELTYPIWQIFNKSVSSSRVPAEWKQGIVSPIHKGDDRHAANNYRPITITSLLCRMLEKLIKKHVMQHLERNELLPKEQHGFVNKKSCLTNLLETMDNITKLLDIGAPVDEIYLDFSKAFDKVPHQHLLYKLELLGIQEKSVQEKSV